MKTLNDLEREAYIKGDTFTASLYGQIKDAETEPCDCEEDASFHMYTDDEYEELLEDYTTLEIKYHKLVIENAELKSRMEGLEK